MQRATAGQSHVVSALTARTQFGQIMRRAKRNRERFLVDRRGEPQVIIMSVRTTSTLSPRRLNGCKTSGPGRSGAARTSSHHGRSI